ncbi:hypothetical protein C0J52_03410 [Blattella germanica]|nr:hypothetical protein C0J52_03410 [Blattella germanica]
MDEELLTMWNQSIENDADPVNKNNETLLVIGIISSQNNFDARKSIRDTWLKLTDQQNVKYHFVVGSEICRIPPEDRLYKETCSEWKIDLTEDSLFSTGKLQTEETKQEMYAGFTFIVQHPIVIHSISLSAIFLSTIQSHVKVSLYSPDAGEKIVSATFPKSSNYSSELLVKPVEPHLLPRGFEGQLIVEVNEGVGIKAALNQAGCLLQWSDGGGLITFQQLFCKDSLLSVNKIVLLLIDYKMIKQLNKEELEKHISKKGNRSKKWQLESQLLKIRLQQESQEYEDILLAHMNANFTFLMKTDDDTFIDIAKVCANLNTIKQEQQSNLCWWSSFREGWTVQAFGKWREDAYRSTTYPPFPCGAGYILSRHLVQFLGLEAYDFLYKNFQGEDVSLGIWLAGLNPQRINNNGDYCTWSCDRKCDSNACNRAELSVEDMYQAWDSFRECDNFCGCQYQALHLMKIGNMACSGALLLLLYIAFAAAITDNTGTGTLPPRPPGAWNATWTDRLKRDLLLNYDKFARPAQHTNTTTVRLGMTFRHIALTWTDEKLKWNESDYGGLGVLHVADHEIWQPDIVLYNRPFILRDTINAKRYLQMLEDYVWPMVSAWDNVNDVIFMQDGAPPNFENVKKVVLPDVSYVIALHSTLKKEIRVELMEMMEWEFVGVEDSRNVKTYACCIEPYIDVTYKLTLRRRSPAYSAIVITPATVIVLMTLVSFWLPPSAGEKILLNGCTALIICIFLLYFSQKLPAMAGHTPLVVLFYSSSLYLVCIATVVSVVVMNLARNFHATPMPWIIKNLLTGWLGHILGLGHLIAQAKSLHHNMMSGHAEELREQQASVFEDHDHMGNSSDDRQMISPRSRASSQHDWVLLAAAIDRIAFLVYSLLFAILAIVYAV